MQQTCGKRVSQVRGGPSTVRNLPALAVPWGGPSKKGKGTNRTGGSTILKLIWGGDLLYFPEFGDLQPYETWKFRIYSETISRAFPDLFRISLRKCLTVLGAPPNKTENLVRRVKPTPDPDTLEKYRETPPVSIEILLQNYAVLLAESSTCTAHLYQDTAPICIAILLH